ncbi:hypothetical protein Q8A73_022013 [Channa argus]|nr:hypothetical protein Q8A73_022013 [Channa argus]
MCMTEKRLENERPTLPGTELLKPDLSECMCERKRERQNDAFRNAFTQLSLRSSKSCYIKDKAPTRFTYISSNIKGLGKTERGEQGRDIDLTSLRSTMPASGPLQGGSASNLNMNLYATKKSAAEGMLDIALFLANITHMKTVIEQGAGYRYYVAVLTLISFSLALQIVAGVLIIIIARRDLNVVSNQRRLDYLNNLATGIIFVTTVINFFVSFFGSKRTGFFRWLLARLHF